jgi:hypothetical protein
MMAAPWTSSRRRTTPIFVSDIAETDGHDSLGIRAPVLCPHRTQGSAKRVISENADHIET